MAVGLHQAKRLAGVEAAVDALAPKPGSYEAVIAENPWIEWMTCDELSELEEIYRKDENGEATAADEKRALSIRYASEARMLSGAPRDVDLPPQPYDIQAAYLKAKRAAELKGR